MLSPTRRFSLFRKYVAQLVEHGKKFLIIGNKNAITYKDIFPLIKESRMWVGHTSMSKDLLFDLPEEIAREMKATKKEGSAYKIVDGVVKGRSQSIWFTNLDHGRRHESLNLMTMEENLKFSKNLKGKAAYDRYENFNAIDVGTYKEIPSDYDGIMGVPVTFLDKYNLEQFEIIGNSDDGAMMREIGVRTLGREFIDAYRDSGGTGHYRPGDADARLATTSSAYYFQTPSDSSPSPCPAR